MASPQTSSPHDDMATSNSGEYLVIISQLLAEKDRLVTEKDELIVSKDRLWREMYQILQEKNESTETTLHRRTTTGNSNRDDLEVQRLREENKRLKRRTQESEYALRDALQADEGLKDDFIGDHSRALPASETHDRVQEMVDVDDYGSDFDINDSNEVQQLFTPVSRATSIDTVERVEVDSRPPVVANIRFVIESTGLNEHIFGTAIELSPVMSACAIESLRALGAFSRFASLSSKGSYNCAERTLLPRETFWTMESPGQFACKTCFNRKQPCMRAIGGHQWIILPLPPAIRDPNLTWQEKSYYIHPYPESSMRYPGTWRRDFKCGKGSTATQHAKLEPE